MSSKKRSLSNAKEGTMHKKARTHVYERPLLPSPPQVVLDPNAPIPTPPPRPRLLSELDADGLDIHRTKPISHRWIAADMDCAVSDDEDRYEMPGLDELEMKRWTRRIALTPLPPSWHGMHPVLMEMSIFTHGSRFVDCCRPPGVMPCSCGASVSCVREHPRYGPVRWHRVCYVPTECCSCLGMLFGAGELSDGKGEEDEEDDDEGEVPDSVCGDCGDCYVVA